jgi:hypothetical protein
MSKRAFFVFAIATFITFDLFILANIAAAHFQSDCGLPAWLGTSGCADDIKRAGFPFIFTEQGGFDGRSSFAPFVLALDALITIAASIGVGLIAQRLSSQNDSSP